jgi:osmotically-inducible protein OsmY
MRTTAIFLTAAGLLGVVGCSNYLNQADSSGATNTSLRQTVQSRLATDSRFAHVDVAANASNNQLTLSGRVTSEQARTDAVSAAKAATDANTAIVDRINVEPEGTTATSGSPNTDETLREARAQARTLGEKIGQSVDDGVIYTRIKARLAADSGVQGLKIRVDVDHSVVTLRGEVESEAAKRDAERIAARTDGVREVHNLLTIGA